MDNLIEVKLAKRKGVVARRGLKEAWSKARADRRDNRTRGVRRGTSRRETTKSKSIKRPVVNPVVVRRDLSNLHRHDRQSFRICRLKAERIWPDWIASSDGCLALDFARVTQTRFAPPTRQSFRSARFIEGRPVSMARPSCW